MTLELRPEQHAARAAFREFFQTSVARRAADFDRAAAMPESVIGEIAARGYFGLGVPAEDGGAGTDLVTLGLLHEQAGRACSSVRSIMTAHQMVATALARWGTRDQRRRWLGDLASGRRLASFCLTEAGAGSDVTALATTVRIAGTTCTLDGAKSWVTGGRLAGVFLVIARSEGLPVAVVVDRGTPGLTITPARDVVGVRASMLAELTFEECTVPADHLIGRPGVGLSHVAATALDMGRYSVAWGCVGLIGACLDASRAYARRRVQFGAALIEHQLVRRLITNMMTDARAAGLLALRAGQLKDAGDPAAPLETVIAKYFAARAAARAAAGAVQIHGAAGCAADALVARCYRDAKIMEIIEGSNEMNQIGIAGWSEADG